MKTFFSIFRKNLPGLLAPLLLLSVALGHLVWTQTSAQSPWKGGGFGMFSTVSSPASRVIKVQLHTSDGIVPIQIPKKYAKQGSRIRTLPTQHSLEGLARVLAAGSWAPVSLAPVQQQYDALAEGKPQNSTLADDLNQVLGDMKMVRLLDDDEPKDLALTVTAIEVTCYEIEFDGKQQQLRLRKLLHVLHSPNSKNPDDA